MKLRNFIKKEISRLAEAYFNPKGKPLTKGKYMKMDLFSEPEDDDDAYDFDKAKDIPDELNKATPEDKTPRDWGKASDKEIRRIGGDVYYGSERSKEPIKGKQRMLVPPKNGWPK
tara:strand:- start:59 stop:403 length:345 start_codon:yes stop_codon:yes gene_type:complete